MAEDLFLIELRQRFATELSDAKLQLEAIADANGWLKELPLEAKKRSIIAQLYSLPEVIVARYNKQFYISLDTRVAGIYWIPVNKDYRVRRYNLSFPFGKAREMIDVMTQSELVIWINRLYAHMYADISMVELAVLVGKSTGFHYNFFAGNHTQEFTVL